MIKRNGRIRFGTFAVLCSLIFTASCADVDIPDARNVNIPAPATADARKKAVNERPDSVMYLPLGEDVLVPEVVEDDAFPREMVGPYELRGETLAGALQLILADYDISLAFETQEGLTRRITVANLRGDLGKVVRQVCALANLYCSYEDGTIVVKDTQTFTVTLPPLGGGGDDAEDTYLEDVAEGLGAILGTEGGRTGGSSNNSNTAEVPEPIVDATTRTIVYSATQRTADVASRYFQRLRANTAMIVFETYIWEVALDGTNSMGIDWARLTQVGKFNMPISVDGSVGAFTGPVSIGLPTASDNATPEDVIEFISQFGAVKTISQPQITVLSGAEAELRVADTQNYVSQIATTLDEGQSTTSVNTDSVDTGFTLTIGSSWDKATVYANVEIELTDVKQIDDFTFSDGGTSGGETIIQLPQTSERQLTTQIRVRPGDSVLIAGLVRENDNFNSKGVGFMKPIIPDSRTSQTENLELVILLRPRVIVYTAPDDKRYVDYAQKKHKLPGTGVDVTSPKELGEKPTYGNLYAEPLSAPDEQPVDEMGTMAAPVKPVIPVSPTNVPPTRSSAPRTSVAPVEPENRSFRAAPQPVMPEPVPLTPPPVVAAPVYVPPPVPVAPAYVPPPTPVYVPPVSAAPAPIIPAPVQSAPVTPMYVPPAPSNDVLTPVPSAPVTPSWENKPAVSPSAPSASSYTPSSLDSARFRRGSGFVSKSDGDAPAAAAVRPVDPLPTSTIPLYAAPAPSAPPASPVVTQPTQAASPSTPASLYETYDYYTPGR